MKKIFNFKKYQILNRYLVLLVGIFLPLVVCGGNYEFSFQIDGVIYSGYYRTDYFNGDIYESIADIRLSDTARVVKIRKYIPNHQRTYLNPDFIKDLFKGNKNIESVDIDWGRDYLGRDDFSYGELKKGNFFILDDMFHDCSNLTSLSINGFKVASSKLIENNNTSINCSNIKIGKYAFAGCSSLRYINIPNGVTEIGEYAFASSSLSSANIPKSVTSIGRSAFQCCSSLTSIKIPGNVTIIGDWTFNYCTSLTSVILPESLTGIGECAFNGCRSLTSINIPENVTHISNFAFMECIYNHRTTKTNQKYPSVNL